MLDPIGYKWCEHDFSDRILNHIIQHKIGILNTFNKDSQRYEFKMTTSKGCTVIDKYDVNYCCYCGVTGAYNSCRNNGFSEYICNSCLKKSGGYRSNNPYY